MDIATEEFSHLEIVGATIQLLLSGVNSSLKDAADNEEIMETLKGSTAKESYIHAAMTSHPEFAVRTGGGPALTNCQGVPWSGAYINAVGELTSDLRSDMAAESRAKLLYEYLLQFTDDPEVKNTLNFLMTREIAPMEMFDAALESIKPNFPPGILQGDSRYIEKYFNMSSDGSDQRGPWNQGKLPHLKEEIQYVDDPLSYVRQTNGLQTEQKDSAKRQQSKAKGRELGRARSQEIERRSSNRW